MADQKGWHKKRGEQVGEHQLPASREHSGALAQPSPLIRPKVKRTSADAEVADAVAKRKVLGEARETANTGIEARRGVGDFDHSPRRVNADQFKRIRQGTGRTWMRQPVPHPTSRIWSGVGADATAMPAVRSAVAPTQPRSYRDDRSSKASTSR